MYNHHKVKPLHIMLPETSAFVKRYYGQTKWIYFLIKDDDLLVKHNTITLWDNVSSDIKKNLISVPVNNKLFLKTKIKSHGYEVQTFYDKKFPKVNSNHSCLAVINLDSALKKDENYYLKEYQYIVKKVIRYINNNLRDFSSSDESDEE